MATHQGFGQPENTAASKKPLAAKKRDWEFIGGTKVIVCFESKVSACVVDEFWEIEEPAPFHDPELSRLTTNINSILDKVAHNPDGKSHLSIISVAGRPFLVWARAVSRPPTGGIGSDDGLTHIVQSLKLQPPERQFAPTTRNWIATGNKTVVCFKSPVDACLVKNFWQAAEFTPWHTEELASATTQIQRLIDQVTERNKNPSRHLAILSYDDRPLLAWVQHDGVSADDDVDTVVRALGLKTS